MYAAYGEHAISGSLPDDAVSVFFTAKPKAPKYPRVHRDQDFAEEWEPSVRSEVDNLLAGKRLWRLIEIEAEEEGYRELP